MKLFYEKKNHWNEILIRVQRPIGKFFQHRSSIKIADIREK